MFLTTTLILHIICGFAALITGFISMLNRKGGKYHRATGKIFFYSMTGVFITATVIAVAKSLAFLFMVGFFSYYMACSGYRALYLKKLHTKQKPILIDWIINLTGIGAGIALVVFSIGWFAGRGAWGFVPLVFGVFCFLSGIQDMSKFYFAPKHRLQRFITHGSRMGGAFAASLTAFIVVNVNLGSYTWILWILPGVLTGIWIANTVSRFVKPQLTPGKAVSNSRMPDPP